MAVKGLEWKVCMLNQTAYKHFYMSFCAEMVNLMMHERCSTSGLQEAVMRMVLFVKLRYLLSFVCSNFGMTLLLIFVFLHLDAN